MIAKPWLWTLRSGSATMPATMAVTQEQIDAARAAVAALNQAIDDGVRQVSVRGQTTTYNTTDSLIRARNDADLRLKSLLAEFGDGTTGSGRIQYLYHAGRGLD